MSNQKGAARSPRSKGQRSSGAVAGDQRAAVITEAPGTLGPPLGSPESLQPTEHDADFVALVAAAVEFPTGEEAVGPFPWPPLRKSGLYTQTNSWQTPQLPAADGQVLGEPVAEPTGDDATPGLPFDPRPAFTSEELRVDVDGAFPTMTISGTIFRLFGGRLTWIARVTADPQTGEYVGSITYRDGATNLLPHTRIRCKLTGLQLVQPGRRARVTFTGLGVPPRTRLYRYLQPNFRTVGIEYDTVEGTAASTSYNLHAHPNRPADLPAATLSIEDVFTRQGLRMTKTNGSDTVPIAGAKADHLWSDLEMHDAMQQHWSMVADIPQWQLWTLFAGRHEIGTGLGGIMFDDIGTAQRQGCAVFLDSFISNPAPAGDPAPAAYVQRMHFWTAVHEIGHTFNLAHSWQKQLGTPWIPLQPVPEERSFMNYPYSVAGGPSAFFANFYYRFSEDELVFLRHAPARFVQQGNALWFDHHGFEQARMDSSGALTLSIRVNRAAARFEALEPVIAEVKLKNTSSVAVVVDKNALAGEDLVVIIDRDGKEPRQWAPYQRYCLLAEPQILEPGQSIYAPLYLSAGVNGFDLADPGAYRIYVALRTDAGDVLSAPLELKVARYESRQQEALADTVFDSEVGRVLAFGGSRVLGQACDDLREVVERVPDSQIAKHAAAALGRVTATEGLVLTQASDGTPEFVTDNANPQAAEPLLAIAYDDLDAAADTFGHIRLTEQVSRTAKALAAEGERERGHDLAADLAQVLEQRGVLLSVVSKVRETAQSTADGH